jgi:hypothetical protein
MVGHQVRGDYWAPHDAVSQRLGNERLANSVQTTSRLDGLCGFRKAYGPDARPTYRPILISKFAGGRCLPVGRVI